MSLGKRIQYYRKKQQLTQEELAEKLSVSRQAVSRWESDSNEPDIKTLLELSDIFGIEVDELVRENKERDETLNVTENESEEIIIHQQEAILETHRKNHRLLVVITTIVIILLLVFVVCPVMTSLGNTNYGVETPMVEKVTNMSNQVTKSKLLRNVTINVGITSYEKQKMHFQGYLSLLGTKYDDATKKMIIDYEDNTTETLDIFLNVVNNDFMFDKEIEAKDIRSITIEIGEQTVHISDVAFPIEEYLYGIGISPTFSNTDSQSFLIDMFFMNSQDGIGYIDENICFEDCMSIYQELSDVEENTGKHTCKNQKVEVYKNNQLIHTEELTPTSMNELIRVEQPYDKNAQYKIVYSFQTPLGKTIMYEKIYECKES